MQADIVHGAQPATDVGHADDPTGGGELPRFVFFGHFNATSNSYKFGHCDSARGAAQRLLSTDQVDILSDQFGRIYKATILVVYL
jgi:hypothetical protein